MQIAPFVAGGELRFSDTTILLRAEGISLGLYTGQGLHKEP